MSYKETCSLCKGNGYITILIQEKDEIKQCWLCESKGEKEYSQAEVDDFIYKTYIENEIRIYNNQGRRRNRGNGSDELEKII